MKRQGRLRRPPARAIATSAALQRLRAAPPARRGGTRRARRGRGRRGGRSVTSPGRGGVPPPTRPAARDRVVRRAKGPRRPAAAAAEPAAGAGDPRHLERLARRQRRQDRRQPARRQRLAGPGRPDHQQAVAAGGRDLERPPQVRAGRAGRRGRARRRPRSSSSGSGSGRGGLHSPAASAEQPPERCRARPPRSPSTSAASAPFAAGDDDRLEAPRPCAPPPSPAPRAPGGSSRRAPARRRARSVAAAPSSSCPEAASSAAAIARSKPGPALRRLAGARLTVIRRSGNSKPRVDDRRAHPLARLPHRGVRQADDREGRQAPVDVDLDPAQTRAATPSRVNVRAVASTGATLGGAAATRGAQNVPDLRAERRAIRAPRLGAMAVAMTVADDSASAGPPRSSSPRRLAPPAGGSSRATPAPATASSTSSRSTGRTLVFVEVKAGRAGAPRGPERPSLAVGPPKQRRLRRLARAWLAESRAPAALRTIRFDVVGVSFDAPAAASVARRASSGAF